MKDRKSTSPLPVCEHVGQERVPGIHSGPFFNVLGLVSSILGAAERNGFYRCPVS